MTLFPSHNQAGFKADSREYMAEMAARGEMVDAVLLDVPYGVREEGAGIHGGNRHIARFPLMHSSDFAAMAAHIAKIAASDDSPVILIMSEGKSSAKARKGYMQALESAGFRLAATGSYTKTRANGKPCMFGRYPLPQEGIYVYSKSGRVTQKVSLELSAVRPDSRNSYPTEKPASLLGQIFGALTCPGDTILDPFAGSGNTAIACERIGRKSICIDILHNPVEYAGI